MRKRVKIGENNFDFLLGQGSKICLKEVYKLLWVYECEHVSEKKWRPYVTVTVEKFSMTKLFRANGGNGETMKRFCTVRSV